MRRVVACGCLVLMFGGSSPEAGASAGRHPGASGDLNCSDFGTRERAQSDFESRPNDVHDLDRDGDGRACETNGSSGWWVWPMATAGLVAGRTGARRRLGDYTMLPGVQGAVFNYRFDTDGSADKRVDAVNISLLPIGLVALPIMGLVRDHVLPRSATPIAIYVVTGVLAAGVMWAVTMATAQAPGPGASAAEDQ